MGRQRRLIFQHRAAPSFITMVGIDMNSSDWIALAAAFAAFLGLIPQFAQITREKSSKKKGAVARATEPAPAEPPEPAKLNAFGRALVLTVIGVAIGVIELVLFSAAANFFAVAMNVATMPTNWLVVFYALFLVPGVCLFWASAHLFNLFE